MTVHLAASHVRDSDSLVWVVPKSDRRADSDRQLDSDDRQVDWSDPDDERAQPGDVIGIESEGETTELGDTAEDEDERRRDVEPF